MNSFTTPAAAPPTPLVTWPSWSQAVAFFKPFYSEGYFNCGILTGTLVDPVLGKFLKAIRIYLAKTHQIVISRLRLAMSAETAAKLETSTELKAYLASQPEPVTRLQNLKHLYGLPLQWDDSLPTGTIVFWCWRKLGRQTTDPHHTVTVVDLFS